MLISKNYLLKTKDFNIETRFNKYEIDDIKNLIGEEVTISFDYEELDKTKDYSFYCYIRDNGRDAIVNGTNKTIRGSGKYSYSFIMPEINEIDTFVFNSWSNNFECSNIKLQLANEFSDLWIPNINDLDPSKHQYFPDFSGGGYQLRGDTCNLTPLRKEVM